MIMEKITYLLLVVLLISGCATPYQKRGTFGGYRDIKLQEDAFKITFEGNGFIGTERAKDYTLLRCAEVALENNYKYFIIVDGNVSLLSESFTTPVVATTQTNSFGNVGVSGQSRVVGNTAYGSYSGLYSGSSSATTTVSGGQEVAWTEPTVVHTIRCFNEKPENVPVIVYDAELVRASVKKQYRIK
ncbi:MAG: hypothetical protein ABH865_09600 [Candidatus Omnitrophota bacterium]